MRNEILSNDHDTSEEEVDKTLDSRTQEPLENSEISKDSQGVIKEVKPEENDSQKTSHRQSVSDQEKQDIFEGVKKNAWPFLKSAVVGLFGLGVQGVKGASAWNKKRVEKNKMKKPQEATKQVSQEAQTETQGNNQSASVVVEKPTDQKEAKVKKPRKWLKRFAVASILCGGGLWGLHQLNPEDVKFDNGKFKADISDEVKWAQDKTQRLIDTTKEYWKNAVLAGDDFNDPAQAYLAPPENIMKFARGKPIEVTSFFNGGANKAIVMEYGKQWCSKIQVGTTHDAQSNHAEYLTNEFKRILKNTDLVKISKEGIENNRLSTSYSYALCRPKVK